ncbi:GNAT family N-acetyltransferase [Nocardia sp. NPDC059240]|uniref:GNAT family N-acetyltransferase n=1 Tax=Nocardia sp. NPDC059240 TaxID=3346786 RepID=UPI0036AE7D81
MRVEITSDAGDFQRRVSGFLDRDPLRHTLICTIVDNEMTGLTVPVEPSYFASVRSGDVVGVAIRTAGHGVLVGEMPDAALPELVTRFAEFLPRVPEVIGAESAASEFARIWSELRGTSYGAGRRERLYRLGRLQVPHAPGKPRPATAADIEVCGQWTADMDRELGGFQLALAESALRARLATGRWWLWEDDGRPVSLTAHQVPIRGWARIGPVYTPPETRGHGYASALVAHVAGTLRAAGQDVCLFTDLANPTSNKIYRAIGFEAVLDQAQYVIGPNGSGLN